MIELEITLPASSAYEDGDTLQVALDGTVVAAAIDLKPGGDDYPGETITTAPVGYGLHQAVMTTFDALGNFGETSSVGKFVATGPRPPAGLKFDAQVGSGPIGFAFTPSPDVSST